ncbi:MAG TPA: hypothetical protein VFA60_02540 [Terriglobales bacterium]|nr:hypothetical protein [Terriglobales bacterium]
MSASSARHVRDLASGATNTWVAYQLPINNAGGQATYDSRQVELVAHFTF